MPGPVGGLTHHLILVCCPLEHALGPLDVEQDVGKDTNGILVSAHHQIGKTHVIISGDLALGHPGIHALGREQVAMSDYGLEGLSPGDGSWGTGSGSCSPPPCLSHKLLEPDPGKSVCLQSSMAQTPFTLCSSLLPQTPQVLQVPTRQKQAEMKRVSFLLVDKAKLLHLHSLVFTQVETPGRPDSL